MAKEATMNTINETHIGKYITIKDPRWNSTSAGIYMGIRTSEWDGKPVHFFQDGHINGIEQTCFAFPVEIAIKNNITVQ
jgi:hypothetical protein